MRTDQPATLTETESGAPARRLHLAVVDDDADVRKALSRLLSSAGCAVTAFASAEAYLTAGRDVEPDCLLLDIGLTGMSGFELREELLRTGATVPIVFITAQDDEETRQTLLQLGSVPCLHKPFTDQSLLSAIAHVTQPG
jgi:FixJ family two-component response regulator